MHEDSYPLPKSNLITFLASEMFLYFFRSQLLIREDSIRISVVPTLASRNFESFIEGSVIPRKSHHVSNYVTMNPMFFSDYICSKKMLVESLPGDQFNASLSSFPLILPFATRFQRRQRKSLQFCRSHFVSDVTQHNWRCNEFKTFSPAVK